MDKIITEKTFDINAQLDNFLNPDKSRVSSFQESELCGSNTLELIESAVSSVDSFGQQHNQVTYQNLLDSGLPLATFAKACKVSKITKWQSVGIPNKHQKTLSRVLKKNGFCSHLKQPSSPTAARFPAFSESQKNASLGILQNLRRFLSEENAENEDFSISENPENVQIIKSTGEVYSPDSDCRVLRFIRQSAARHILKGQSRVCWCLRRVNKNELPAVLLDKATSKAHYGGLMSCSLVWDCAVDAAKVSQRRRNELFECTQKHRANGGALLLVTYTFAHTKHDVLADMLRLLFGEPAAKSLDGRRFIGAFDSMKASHGFKALKSQFNVLGTVRGLETTVSEANGWHPHVHEIWFLDCASDDVDMRTIKRSIFADWQRACIRKGLGTPDFSHGVDVKDGTHASEYVSKWGIEDEITKSAAKKSRSGFTPFQLLDLYVHGDKNIKKQAAALFAEYSAAFKGRRQLCWSRGLRKHFDLMPELTDKQIALEQPESAFLLGKLELDQWSKVLQYRSSKRDCRAELLGIAERGGWDDVLEYIDSLN